MANLSLLMLSDGYGLNKEARLRREEELRGKKEELVLNPLFPYEVLGFDERYFQAEPSEAEPKPTS